MLRCNAASVTTISVSASRSASDPAERRRAEATCGELHRFMPEGR